MITVEAYNARREKRALRWKKYFEKQRALYREIREHGSDILESEGFKSSESNIQHGNMTVSNHCMNVAKYSLAISNKLPFKFSNKELVRGALLHDYFLYDWHKHDPANEHKNLHGFYHPGIALRNATRDFDLTHREKDIIKKHMWPMTIVPPTCREAWIVTMADKYCSFMETFHLHKGHGPKKVKVLSNSNNEMLR